MYKIIFSLYLFLNVNIAFSQKTNIYRKINFVYTTKENPFFIHANGCNCKKLKVTSNGGYLKKTSPCIYNIDLTQNLPKNYVLTLFIWKNRKLIDSVNLDVKRVPDPVIQIESNGLVLKPDIYRTNIITNIDDSLNVNFGEIADDLEFNFNFTIKSFDVYVSKGDKLLKVTNNGKFFSEEVKLLIKGAENIISFDNIVVIDEEGKKRKLNPIIYEMTGISEW